MGDPGDFNAGVVAEDDLLHAAARFGAVTVALCGAGRIRYAAPTPFVPSGRDNCPRCAQKVRGSVRDNGRMGPGLPGL